MSSLENMAEDFMLITKDSFSLLISSYPYLLSSEYLSGSSYLEISNHEIRESQKQVGFGCRIS